MSEPVPTATPWLPDEPPAVAPSLESLRNDGAHRFDPARFVYLEALSRRVAQAAGELRHILDGKLAAGLADYARRVLQAQQAASDEAAQLQSSQPEKARMLRQRLKAGDYPGLRRQGAATGSPEAAAPLAGLNDYIRTATQPPDANPPKSRDARVELKSVRRFRQVWSRIAAADQVDRAIGRGPENAGPLNSHMLVLRSLALMRSLSPDYLRRFMSHAESLLWLEEEGQKPAVAETKAKAARRSKPGK